MNRRFLLSFILSILFFHTVQSQILTTKGKEFYLTYMYNRTTADTSIIYLYLTATQYTTGNISNPNTGFSIPFSITAGNVTSLEIPKYQGTNFIPGVVQNCGLIITASDTIAAFAYNSKKFSSDATNVIQKDALGTKYLVACYDGGRVFPDGELYAAFAIEATEDNTSISITPSVNTYNGQPAGVPFTVVLNKGQTYYVKALANLSGSLVSVNNDCKKIAVFSGAEDEYVPIHTENILYSTDHLWEQLYPVNTFGRQFITTKMKGRNVYIARVYAAYDNTSISSDGVVQATINAGKYFDFVSPNQPKFITTSNPSQVMMFAASTAYDALFGPLNDGDPTMIAIPPVEQQITSSIFLSLPGGTVNLHKVNIVCKTADIFGTTLDGVNVGNSFSVVTGNPVYSYAALDISEGQHRIGNPDGFISYAYGFGSYQGYGYCTGSAVANIDAYFTCNGFSSINHPVIDVCTGPAVFNVVTSAPNAGYTWDFGDGSPTVSTNGTVLQQTHNYPAAGNYIVKMTATSSVGNTCDLSTSNTTQLTLHVVSSLVPSVSIVVSPTGAVCGGDSVSLIASAVNAGPSAVYQWKVNGNVVGTNSPAYTANTFANNDIVSCTVTSSLSCAASATATANITMKINSSIAPSITIATDSLTICSGTITNFTATIGAGITQASYQWKVNGVNKGGDAATFNYTPVNGDDIVCVLTVSGGCYNPKIITSNTIHMSVQAAANSPSVSIAVPQTTICAGTNTSFTATPLYAGISPAYQWQLNGANIGGNSAGFASSSLHNNDVISCVLTSSQGCLIKSTAVSNAITMAVNPIVNPTVTIAADAPAICEGATLQITAVPTGGGTTPVYQWKINGITAGTDSPVLNYANFKNNDAVACTMTSNAACAVNPAVSNSIIVNVNASLPATTAIETSANNICKGDAVSFTAQVVNGGASPVYKWFINNALVNGAGSEVFTTTALNKNEQVRCEVTSALACADTAASNEITMLVNDLPTVVFDPAEVIVLKGTYTALIPSTTGNITSYLWTPANDLSSSNSPSVVTSATQNTTYQLTVSTDANCKATASVAVKVFSNLLMPAAFTPDGNGINDIFRVPPGLTVKLKSFTIFSRWGEKVFESTDATKGWDGKLNGVKQPGGAYLWMIYYEDPFDKKIVFKKGTVLLVR